MKFKIFFITFIIITACRSAMPMKPGFLLGKKTEEKTDKKEASALKKGFFLSNEEREKKRQAQQSTPQSTKKENTPQKEEEKSKEKMKIFGRFTINGHRVCTELDIDSPLPGGNGETILHTLVQSKQDQKDNLITWLDHGASVNVQDNDKRTPLYYAILEQNSAIAQLFLERGADPNIEDNLGLTPLDMAQAHEWQLLVDLLKKYGAKNSSTTDEDYQTIVVTEETLKKVAQLSQKELQDKWSKLYNKALDEKSDPQKKHFKNFYCFCKKYNIPISDDLEKKQSTVNKEEK